MLNEYENRLRNKTRQIGGAHPEVKIPDIFLKLQGFDNPDFTSLCAQLREFMYEHLGFKKMYEKAAEVLTDIRSGDISRKLNDVLHKKVSNHFSILNLYDCYEQLDLILLNYPKWIQEDMESAQWGIKIRAKWGKDPPSKLRNEEVIDSVQQIRELINEDEEGDKKWKMIKDVKN